MSKALDILKAAATNQMQVVSSNPVDIFLNKINQQITYVSETKEGKQHNTRSLWFKKNGNEYVVRIGRMALEIGGAKAFKANDLDAVVVLLNAAKDEIQSDKKLQDTIAVYSMERSERLKQGRANKKAK